MVVGVGKHGIEEVLCADQKRSLVLPGVLYLNFVLVGLALALVLAGHVGTKHLLHGEWLIADFARIKALLRK